jgi:hypothetical protein
MKQLYILVIAVLLTANMFAQAPQKMSYQAVVRNAANALVTTQAVGMKISILQGSANGTAVYVETQTPTTNANGLVSLEIGSGTVLSGTFASINWVNGTYFIKTETDPTGGTTYTITGANQLMSVPFALHANTASSIVGPVAYDVKSAKVNNATSGVFFTIGSLKLSYDTVLKTIVAQKVAGSTGLNNWHVTGHIINGAGSQGTGGSGAVTYISRTGLYFPPTSGTDVNAVAAQYLDALNTYTGAFTLDGYYKHFEIFITNMGNSPSTLAPNESYQIRGNVDGFGQVAIICIYSSN